MPKVHHKLMSCSSSSLLCPKLSILLPISFPSHELNPSLTHILSFSCEFPHLTNVPIPSGSISIRTNEYISSISRCLSSYPPLISLSDTQPTLTISCIQFLSFYHRISPPKCRSHFCL